MWNLVLCLAVLPLAIAQGGSSAPAAPVVNVDSIEYRFENERFLVSRIELELDPAGRGKLVFVRKGLAKPIEREVRVTDEVVREIGGLLDRSHFLDSGETYQTQADHSNLGLVTITVVRGAARRETRFNYTTNRDMAALQTLLRGIANREIFAFDLETAMRFQPLETPNLLGALGSEIDLGRITEPDALVPLLRLMSEDVSLPLIARNRAGALADRIDGRKRP